MPLESWSTKPYIMYSLMVVKTLWGSITKLRWWILTIQKEGSMEGPKFESNSRQNETRVEVKMNELEGLHRTLQLTKRSSLTSFMPKPKGFLTCTDSTITKGHVLGIKSNEQSCNLNSRAQQVINSLWFLCSTCDKILSNLMVNGEWWMVTGCETSLRIEIFLAAKHDLATGCDPIWSN